MVLLHKHILSFAARLRSECLNDFEITDVENNWAGFLVQIAQKTIVLGW